MADNPFYPTPLTPDPSNAGGEPWKNVDPLLVAAPVPGGDDTPGKGVTTVNVEAIKLFATNIETLLPWIRIIIDEIDGIAIGAGNLGAGNALAKKILDPNQLRESSRTVLTQAQNVIMDVAQSCRQIAARYKTAEELNELDVDEFSRQVAKAKGEINNLNLGT